MGDDEIREQVDQLLATVRDLSARVSVRRGVVRLEGFARREETRRLAERLARKVAGVRGVENDLVISWGPPRTEGASVDSEIERLTHSPRGAMPVGPSPEEVREIDRMPPLRPGPGLGEVETFSHDQEGPQEGLEPDFSEVIGTTDPLQAVEDADPYFPPTDPVVQVASDWEEGAEVLGGYSPTAADEVDVEGMPVTGTEPGDEQITEAVLRELQEDAATSGLNILVFTRNGTVHLRGRVPTLLDAELAEEVASRVPGVVEVRDELDIEERLLPR